MGSEGGEGAEQDDLHDANATRESPRTCGNNENRRDWAENDAIVPYRHNAHLRKRP
jgi:hypothetical protein